MTISIHLSDRNLVNATVADLGQKQLAQKAIELAIQEDFGLDAPVDLTTQATVGANLKVRALLYCKQSDVYISGLSLIEEICRHLDDSAEVKLLLPDGAHVQMTPEIVAEIVGKGPAILGIERTLLNLLQRMSGITTMTRRFVERAEPHGVAIMDTRKTTPGLRVFERLAVRLGGGVNHRFGLHDKILLKDNHLSTAGGVAPAVKAIRKAHPNLEVEVECSELSQVDEALKEGVEKIMLDNMTPQMVQESVAMIDGRCFVEVSGGIDLSNLDNYLLPGVDAISVGALTHSVKSVDLSLEVEGYL